MKIGVFSDIHGNLFAFKEILSCLKREKCDLHLFLGDVCGYYYHQNEVISLLEEIPSLKAIIGNHDSLFLESLGENQLIANYTENFGLSFEIFKKNITQRSLNFLKGLSKNMILEDIGLAAFHGSPWNPLSEYIYPDSPMEGFADLPYSVVFLGHTHRSMDIKRNGIRIINPGSAGQPRDGNWPSYAVYDSEKKQVKIKFVRYPVEKMIDEVRKREEKNHYLIDVLRRIKR